MGFRILITGASGLLGHALYRCFSKEKIWTILGLVLTRAGDDLKMVDITKTDELFTVMQEFKVLKFNDGIIIRTCINFSLLQTVGLTRYSFS